MKRLAAGFLSRRIGPVKERGAMALLVSAVLLLGATMITMHTAMPVRVDQQIVSNEYRSMQALNAAEAGLSHLQGLLLSDPDDIDAAINSLTCGVPIDLLDDQGAPRGSYEVIDIDGMGCAWASSFVLTDVAGVGLVEIEVTVRGYSDDGTGQRTLRQKLFILDLGDGGGPGSMAAMNFAGDVNAFNAANSNAFYVDGAGGPAVMLQNQDSADVVTGAIEGNDRMDNYIGGVEHGDMGSPWGNPGEMIDFVNAVEAGSHTSHAGNAGFGGNTKISGVHVVNGDATFSGNAGSDDSTVLIVKGNLTTQGTPDFNGLIIVLGGTYDIGGGGGGGLEGSVFVANLQEDGTYGESSLNVAGGGNADFTYSHDALAAARDLLSDEAREMWQLADPEGPPDTTIYDRGVISGHVGGSWADF